MSAARSPQPLFELLAKGQSDALTRRAKSFIPSGAEGADAIGAVPATSGEPAGPASPPARDSEPVAVAAARTVAVPAHAKPGSVQIPLVWLYGGAAAVLLLLVGTWAVAFSRGGAAREAEWQELMASRGGSIGADPLIEPAPKSVGTPAGTDTSQGGAAPRTDRTGTGGGTTLSGGTRLGILSSAGVLPTDPRQPGRNYLKLAVLGRADAEHAIAYLGSAGIEAIGVPVVDPGARSANNPARYEVFATVGITGEEYKNNRPVRTELEARVARTGERYRRDAKGSTDFAKPLWMKHNP